MPRSAPFDALADRYDRWFETYQQAYQSELTAIEQFVPSSFTGLEIGVGTGRFAGPLGIQVGIDPAEAMLAQAVNRGVSVVTGIAEQLPFQPSSFDLALIVTTICFVDDIEQTLREVSRILEPDSTLLIGYIDKTSPVGQQYQAKKADNPFYRDATFVSTAELLEQLKQIGFREFAFTQTIFHPTAELREPDPVKNGYGEGSFVVIKCQA